MAKRTDKPAGTDVEGVANRPGSVPMVDAVAMVSRNADNSDAQPNPTVRILSKEDSAKADKAQEAINTK